MTVPCLSAAAFNRNNCADLEIGSVKLKFIVLNLCANGAFDTIWPMSDRPLFNLRNRIITEFMTCKLSTTTFYFSLENCPTDRYINRRNLMAGRIGSLLIYSVTMSQLFFFFLATSTSTGFFKNKKRYELGETFHQILSLKEGKRPVAWERHIMKRCIYSISQSGRLHWRKCLVSNAVAPAPLPSSEPVFRVDMASSI